ncbi:Homeobox-leucine zipper protein HAT14 [Triticum urartu]|uniref:Homeobox-leucine zipper protein HAT14 n=1 Tax=Triticum urartu TaxID=4572 RepID=M7YNK4_TRIUA|nr:Homeobox-leucine zipper protein HAT14 [Triticum urartu]
MMHRAAGLDLDLGLGLGLASQGSLTFSTTTDSSSPASASHSQHWTTALSSVVVVHESYGLHQYANQQRKDEPGMRPAHVRPWIPRDRSHWADRGFFIDNFQKQKTALANRLGLRQGGGWFQTRRARTKLKQTEVDCEYMKRWCDQLAEQNRRLEKEVAELRALKVAPPANNGAPAGPLTTLTMCLSCKRVASTSSASACNVPSFSSNAGIGMPMPSAEQRQFFCAFRDTGAMYGGTSGLAKVVKPTR